MLVFFRKNCQYEQSNATDVFLFQYGLNELKLRFRTRLARHLYEKYLQ